MGYPRDEDKGKDVIIQHYSHDRSFRFAIDEVFGLCFFLDIFCLNGLVFVIRITKTGEVKKTA